MKTKHLSWPLMLSISLMFILVGGCNQQPAGGNIPYQEDSVRGHILPIAEAVQYTRQFREIRDGFYRQLPAMENAMNFGQAEAFNRDALAVLLNQKDGSGGHAAGVRIYYGLDKAGLVRMVLVPYDGKGNDIVNQLVGNKAVSLPGISSANAYWDNGQTIENGQRCPTLCGNGLSGLGGN
jgi:hypothetical protein